MQQMFELLVILACVLFGLKTIFEITYRIIDSFRGDGLVDVDMLYNDDFEPEPAPAPISDPQMQIIRMIDDELPRDMPPVERFMLAMSIEEQIEAALIQHLSKEQA
ncbi:MAG: hypothetical protein IPK17_01595 [Chloroflexi bacterium]|uniref:hypothetical protein n=1 Tax=Candidatus Flexifilum breve TaxID=3140694 RepID=UPI003136CE8B|nr:hypothetical protein [Chloroflexota bacterium]